MHINTQLSVKDVLRAYREWIGFYKTYPLALVLVAVVYGLLSWVPDALFPIKMAAYAVAITVVTCVTTALYRTGDWRQVMAELKFQQRLLVPALLLVVALSVLGYAIAEQLLPLVTQSSGVIPAIQAQPAATEQVSMLMVATLATALICISQVMPYVLAHFCRGLSLSKQQGERIWVALMLNGVTLMAFSPLALATPLLMAFGAQATEAVVLISALYCSFLLFIVFNIQKATPVRTTRLVAEGSC